MNARMIRITPITTSRWMAPNVIFTASHSTSQAMMNTIPSSERTAFMQTYPGSCNSSPGKPPAPGGFPLPRCRHNLLWPPIQYPSAAATAWTDARQDAYSVGMRELRDVRKLDDRFGQFLVRVKCPACGASRDIAAEALARLVGWSMTLENLAPRLRCSKCGAKGTATVTPVGLPRPRGFTSNPH